MNRAFFALATLALATTTATAQDASIWSHQLGKDAALDSGWVVTIPGSRRTGSAPPMTSRGGAVTTRNVKSSTAT